MACKNGIRKSIESSKKYYQEQRKPDPFRDFWKELIRRVYESPEGFDGLSSHEKTYFAVCMLDGEVYNGGFDQFFFNSSGDYYQAALSGLAELGAFHSRELLIAARLALFSDGDLSRDTETRRAVLRHSPDDSATDNLLNNLDDKYYADPDKLDRLRKFAIENHLVRLG